MANISPHQDLITVIDTFTVRPERQYQLILILNRATEEVMKHLPGFVSASIHQGILGDKVVNYAQWKTKEHLLAMQKNPEAQEHMRAAVSVAESSEPVLCMVASSQTNGKVDERNPSYVRSA